MKTATTLLARVVLRYIRRVDPKVLAQIKGELRDFNSRSKSWQDCHVQVSERQ